MADQYDFLYVAFKESHELIRAKLTHDGRADQYYAKVTDCPTLRRLLDIEIEKIYDLEDNVAQLPAPPTAFANHFGMS